jgi:hypothetical protein
MVDLLYETRRPPEVIINLTINKRRVVERLYNDEEIKSKYNKLMEDRKKAHEEAKEKRKKEREEEKQKKKDEMGENYVEEPVQEEEEPEDTTEAPDLAKMQQEAKDALNTRFDSDFDAVDALVKEFAGKRVLVVQISADNTAENTYKKIKHALRTYLDEREYLYERALAYSIDPPEVPFTEKVFVDEI